MNVVPHEHAAERGGAVGHRLGEANHVGDDAITLGGESIPQPAKAGDDLIEDEEDAMSAGDLAQTLEIALRAREHASGAEHRLDDDGCDRACAIERHDAGEAVGEVGADLRLATRIRQSRARVGRGEPVDLEQRLEQIAVLWDAADRGATDAGTVIATLEADEAGARALPGKLVKSERDLERGVDGLGAGIAVEHMAEVARGECGKLRGEAKRCHVTELK